MNKKKFWEFDLSTTQMIAAGFLLAILLGSILLCLPISSVSGNFTPYIDSLFTATTSVCVTGLVVVNTFEYWSVFGQTVILILIQFGGLGIVTFTTLVMIIIGKKVTLKNRLLIQDAYNLNSMSGLVKFTRNVVRGSLIVEGIGALLYMIEFIPRFGVGKGIWVSVFNSVSAFCNAGMDLVGPYSLAEYVDSPLVSFTTMALIVLGGIGFIVWFDFLKVIKLIRKKEVNIKFIFTKLSLHSKIVLVTTLGLLLFGTIMVLILEYDNPGTLGDLPWWNKIMVAMFQSVTVRTAGFFTISQKALRQPTALICMMLMFIGGSPVGTAGGIKTISFALIVIAVIQVASNNEDTVVFRREIPRGLIRKTLAVASIDLFVVSMSAIFLMKFNGGNGLDTIFEVVSAVGTVGLSRDYTGTLNLAGKIIIVVTMYLGRIGPITMAIAFRSGHKKKALVKYSKENVIIG